MYLRVRPQVPNTLDVNDHPLASRHYIRKVAARTTHTYMSLPVNMNERSHIVALHQQTKTIEIRAIFGVRLGPEGMRSHPEVCLLLTS